MAHDETELQEFYLRPGEFRIAHGPALLKTVLGSCVGVTFWCARLDVGALCHGVLPRSPAVVAPDEGYRYVDFAVRELARQFAEFGAAHEEVQIKVFGGADVLPVHSNLTWRATVGHQNWHSALEVLHELNFTVLASDLGGSAGRTIQFHTGTGEVLLRRLANFVPDDAGELRGCKP